MANIKKNAQGYGYKYTDLAAINDYIESIGETYYQETETVADVDYIITVRLKDDTEVRRVRGCRVIQASLSGKTNPAQEQGSGLTYARRYSLLMAYGLASEDDDGESLTRKPAEKRDRIAESKEAREDLLVTAKTDINEELERQGYTTAVQKKAFIKKVLDKETIDTMTDAELVGDQLENEA